tara:strand:+ start:1599 stop:2216 length:618 start_codon:yes stop_codon:yes gene_type:complete
MRQQDCFKLFDKHFNHIKQEFLNHKNQTKLNQHDFSDGAGTYVKGEWYAIGISCMDIKVQNEKLYPILYSILNKFPYKMNCAFMVVEPNTSIGTHKDKEGGWRYQLCIDDGGGDNSGLDYCFVNKDGWPQTETHIFKTGNSIVIQPGIMPHNGWNNNKNKRVTLLLDFFNENCYNKKLYNEYYKKYDNAFNLEQLVRTYEQRKVA